MLSVTTPAIDGRRVTRCLGIASGEAILGTKAVLSLDLDHETIQVGGGMPMVSASGTAVVLA